MKFLNTSLLAALFVLLGSHSVVAVAQDGCPPAASAPTATEIAELQKAAKDRGFLWRISRGGTASYLYGTIHVSKLEWAFPGPQLVQAVLQSDTVALELNLIDPATMSQLGQAMLDKTGLALPAALEARVARQAVASCLPAAQIKALLPEFQIVTLTVFALKRQGIDPSYGADSVIAGIASSTKKPIEALETVADQLKLMQANNPAEALKAMEEGLVQLEDGSAQTLMGKLAQSWADSDHSTINSYADWCKCLTTDKERANMKRVLDDRNLPMAQRIDTLHTQGRKVFTAVGALHMIGPMGLPALMQQRGFVVEKVF
jgi:uncharacterized protein